MDSNMKSELMESIQRNEDLENYFANTIIPQIYVNADLVLCRFTPHAMKQFNLSQDDIGRKIFDIDDKFRFPTLMENIHYVIDHKDILEKEIQTTDRSWFQMNILPYVRRQDNHLDGVIITFVDITRRINDLKEQERLIAENEVLFDTVVHDIKGPISVLTMTVSELKKGAKLNTEEYETMIAIQDNTIKKMSDLVNNLSAQHEEEYKRSDADELLNFEHIFEDVLLTLRNQIHETDAEVVADIKYSQIRFSRRNLRSILYNLVHNSLKYKSPDRIPKVQVTSTHNGEYTVISVKDNGMGIASDQQEHVFEKYIRLNEASEGSGVGLHLVKQIVKNAGGRIELQSEPGKGTEVRVFLITDGVHQSETD